MRFLSNEMKKMFQVKSYNKDECTKDNQEKWMGSLGFLQKKNMLRILTGNFWDDPGKCPKNQEKWVLHLIFQDKCILMYFWIT